MQKITVVGYNRDEEEPVTPEEINDAFSIIGLSDVDIQIEDLEDE